MTYTADKEPDYPTYYDPAEYMIVVLRNDQIDLIARRVVELLNDEVPPYWQDTDEGHK